MERNIIEKDLLGDAEVATERVQLCAESDWRMPRYQRAWLWLLAGLALSVIRRARRGLERA